MYTEDMLEQMTMNIFSDLGYEVINGYNLERDNTDVLYEDYIFMDLKKMQNTYILDLKRKLGEE